MERAATTNMSDLTALFDAMGALGPERDKATRRAAHGGFKPDPRFANDSCHTGNPATLQVPAASPGQGEPAPDPLDMAHAGGFVAGHAAGRAEAEAEAARQRDATARLTLAFSRLDADLAEQLRQRLVETVAALCEDALAPMALDRERLAARVARAVAMFSRAEDERVVRLNPDDLDAVRAALPVGWNFLPDPALVPGALRVETANGGAEDGPVQWRRAIARALDPAVGQ